MSRLEVLYARNDEIECELNRLNHNIKTADGPRKEELLTELQSVIDEIEKLESFKSAEQQIAKCLKCGHQDERNGLSFCCADLDGSVCGCSCTFAPEIAPEATPLPWHVYEGGNFVRIGAEGYEEYMAKENYLGGPLCVGETHYYATENYDSDHEKALVNAKLIVEAVNSYYTLKRRVETLEKALRRCAEAGRAASGWMDGVAGATPIRDDLLREYQHADRVLQGEQP